MFNFILYRLFRIPLPMRVRYDRHPKDSEVTILFIHGIASSYLAWKSLLPKISKDKDFDKVRLIAIDLIGFGRSPKPKWYSYNYKNYIRSLNRTIKKLKIRGPLIIAGHSMGSLIAINYAHEYPENLASLVLVSPPILRPSDLAEIPDKFYHKTYSSLNKHRDDKIVGTLAGFISKVSSFDSRSLNTRAFQETMDNLVLNNQNWNAILNLKLPIRIIHGHLDPLVMGVNLRKLCRDSSCIQLTESIGGHDVAPPKLHKVILNLKEALRDITPTTEAPKQV